MRDIDPNDPIYKGLTKSELLAMKALTREDKDAVSMQIFGEPSYGPPSMEWQRDQRWAALLGETPIEGTPYRVTHQHLLYRIERNRRVPRQGVEAVTSQAATVSAFADWVFRLYRPPPSPAMLIAGKIGELAVVDRRVELSQLKREIPRWEHRGWRLIHDGVRGSFDEGISIPSLTVNGVPLRGIPDLVFRQRKSDRLLFVELKVSSAPDLPSDGWPNIRAQLWAYSHIRRWPTTAEILLAGEVWSDSSPPLWRKTWLWRSTDSLLHQQCSELFFAFGGTVKGSTK